MIAYFPKPYKDELYYSILARYHYHSGNEFKSQTLNELTGRYIDVNIELPVGLDYMVSKVKLFSNQYTKDYFVNSHTVIPFVKIFKNEEWTKESINYSLKASVLFDLSERKKGDVESKKNLYYCSDCFKEQFNMYGEAYWNRIHQIPGIFVCTNHRTVLNLLSRHSLRDKEFIIPKLDDITQSNNIYSVEVMDCLINLTRDVEYIINMNFEPFSREYFFQKYKTLIELKGIAYPTKKRYQKLCDLMLDYYPIEFLELLNSSFKRTDNLSWLSSLNGKGYKFDKLHPIRHLLLMRLLCGSARNFFEKEYSYEPFGKGPWICMNPLADHYLQNVVTEVDIRIHESYRVVRGDMRCSCGFVYRLMGEEKSPLEVKKINGRIVEKGHVWDQKFNEFIERKLPLKEIATHTNMGVETVRRILKRHNLNNEEIEEAKKIRKKIEKTSEYKNIWINLRMKYPDYTRVQLIKLNRKVYNWLRKYDKEWIESNSPESNVGKNCKVKKYSFDEDIVFLRKAEKLILEWPDYEKLKNSLVRKSKNRLLSMLGLKRTCFERAYPLTAEYIESHQELICDFQKRRVISIIENRFNNERVTVAQVAITANVAEIVRAGEKEISEFIIKEVELHNNNLL